MRYTGYTLAIHWLYTASSHSFAKSGNPNTLRAVGSPEWTPYDNATDRNIKFADPISFETGFRKEQCDYCAGTSRCEGGPGGAG